MYRRSFKDYFGRNRKSLYMILGILLVSVFSLTIVYAALSVTLNIVGNAEVVSSTWDIHLDNVKVTSGSVSGDAPTITGGTTATFSTILTTPGDFYEFTIDVVNDGSIDAMIDSISKNPSLTTAQAKYLKYEITYQNGDSINTKQLVKKNDYVRLKVRVEYRKDITASDLPTTSETLNLAFTVNYVQSDGTGNSVTDNGTEKKLINVVSGDGTQTGDEVCIGEECFYVMYSDETTVTMLAKYNLYVGGEYNSSWTTYGDEATGKQDSTMIGYGTTPYKGTTKFSNTNYWTGTVSSYPVYVYDSNSTLYNYVENYKTYLSTLGVTPSEARLITYEELTALGCSGSDYSCSNAPEWVYSTSYWSGSVSSSSNVWFVNSEYFFYNRKYSNNNNYGCRPVIVIAKDKIIETDSSVKSLIEFTIGDETYQAEEGMTWEQWVNSDYNIPSPDPNTTKFYVEVEYICRAVNLDTPDTEYDWITYDQNGDSDVLATDVIENRAYYLI